MENPLPDDLLHQILIKLPIKSLVRFRCVCKHWYSYISNPYFISSHKSIPVDPTLLFRRISPSNQEIFTLHSDTPSFQPLQTLPFPFQPHGDGPDGDCFSIMGCVDGLVCLWDSEAHNKYGRLIVWNPAVRKCVMSSTIDMFSNLTNPNTMFAFNRVMCFGFAFDEVSNDYKVMTVGYFHLKGSGLKTDLEAIPFGAVFSVNMRTWRLVRIDPESRIHSRPCTLGSVIYRISRPYSDSLVVGCFDVRTEVYSKFRCPEGLGGEKRYYDTELSILHDSLALVHRCDDSRFDIWVMREEGVGKAWDKLHTIEFSERWWMRRVIGFGESGIVVVVAGTGEGGLVGEDNPFIVKFVGVEGESKWHLESYRETLVLLDNGDSVPEGN